MEIDQSGVGHHVGQLGNRESEPSITQAIPGPLFRVGDKVEHQYASVLPDHRGCCLQGLEWILRVVQCLRQKRDVGSACLNRGPLELTQSPVDVADVPPSCEFAGAFQHRCRPVDCDHLRCPARHFQRQETFTASEVNHGVPGQEQPEPSGPRGPASSWYKLPATASRGPAVGLGAVATLPQHRAQPGLILVVGRVCGGGVEPRPQEGPHRTQARVMLIWRRPQEREATFALFGYEPSVAKQTHMSRDARLGYSQDCGQLADIQALLRQQPEQPQPCVIPQKPEQRARHFHIHESTYVDVLCQGRIGTGVLLRHRRRWVIARRPEGC